MTERKNIAIPQGMLEAVVAASPQADRPNREFAREFYRPMLEAALGWLAGNPIEPTQEQSRKLHADVPQGLLVDEVPSWHATEWQRRMFLAPDPASGGDEQIHKDLADLVRPEVGLVEALNAAYRRGAEAGSRRGCFPPRTRRIRRARKAANGESLDMTPDSTTDKNAIPSWSTIAHALWYQGGRLRINLAESMNLHPENWRTEGLKQRLDEWDQAADQYFEQAMKPECLPEDFEAWWNSHNALRKESESSGAAR